MSEDHDDPTGRALALLSCLTGRAHWAGAELAGRLGVTTRTVRRDIERLRRLGYEIDASAGTDGGYRLRAGAIVPPLFLDDDEAIAVVTALLAAASNATTGMVDASARALSKLHHVLPAAVRGRAEAVRRAAHTAVSGQSPAVDPERIATLAESCRDGAGVRFGYVARHGRPSQRRVEPHALVTARGAWYLVAYDLDRNDWRVFRVDRLDGDVERTGHGIARRTVPGGDPLAYLAMSLAEMPTAHAADIELAIGAAELLAELRWLNPRRVDDTGAGSCRVRLGSTELAGLTREVVDVISTGSTIAVHAGPEVREHLTGVATILLRATGD